MYDPDYSRRQLAVRCGEWFANSFANTLNAIHILFKYHPSRWETETVVRECMSTPTLSSDERGERSFRYTARTGRIYVQHDGLRIFDWKIPDIDPNQVLAFIRENYTAEMAAWEAIDAAEAAAAAAAAAEAAASKAAAAAAAAAAEAACVVVMFSPAGGKRYDVIEEEFQNSSLYRDETVWKFGNRTRRYLVLPSAPDWVFSFIHTKDGVPFAREVHSAQGVEQFDL